MKTIAYVRVSTDAQDVTHQRLAVLEFARTERMVVDTFLEIQASSRHSLKVRQIEVLFDSLERGDTLIVSELSRLGRSVGWCTTRFACSPSKRACVSPGHRICSHG